MGSELCNAKEMFATMHRLGQGVAAAAVAASDFAAAVAAAAAAKVEAVVDAAKAKAAAEAKAAFSAAQPAIAGWTRRYSRQEKKVSYNRTEPPQARVWSPAKMVQIAIKDKCCPHCGTRHSASERNHSHSQTFSSSLSMGSRATQAVYETIDFDGLRVTVSSSGRVHAVSFSLSTNHGKPWTHGTESETGTMMKRLEVHLHSSRSQGVRYAGSQEATDTNVNFRGRQVNVCSYGRAHSITLEASCRVCLK
jgi:hypothetical protein